MTVESGGQCKDATGVAVFTAKLSTGGMVLVHPIRVGKQVFLPCCYGYATTIRRAQGSSLHLGALWFDHCYPPERGYGYVGASRFRSRDGLFLYGRIRRSDWTPVGAQKDDWALRRGCDSMSSESDNDSGRSVSVSSDSDSRGYQSDDSDDAGFIGEETDSDASCGGDYWDEHHSSDNDCEGRASDDSDSN